MSSDSENAEPELSFRDAEDYVEQRRQKEILDATQFVLKKETETESEYERGHIDMATRRAEVRAAVNGLIIETEQIIRKSGNAGLLKSRPLAKISLEPPEELVGLFSVDNTRVWGRENLSPKTVYTVYGVQGYLDAPTEFTATWSVQVETRHDGLTPLSRSVSARMPVSASMSVYRVIKAFLSDVGLDLEPELEDYTGQGGPGL